MYNNMNKYAFQAWPLYEKETPHHEKTCFLHMRKQMLISAFVFATYII